MSNETQVKFDVTDVDTVELVKKVYELSLPQGMGFLHFNSQPLTDEEAQSLIAEDGEVHLDYVRGRACKFSTYKEKDKFFIRYPWYDHTDQQFIDLLDHIGIKHDLSQEEHGMACNCSDCQVGVDG